MTTTDMTPAPAYGFGTLAQEDLDLRLPLQVLRSGAGFYIGTCSDELGPVSRESVEYWRDEESALNALQTGEWTQRQNP